MNLIQASSHTMISSTVYTVTVIDLRNLLPLGIRRTPLICTELEDAIYAVKNNLRDLADGSTYQYAVIERSLLNEIRPNLEQQSMRLWYKYNSVIDEFEPSEMPVALRNQTGFGIG
jgi:hypothetical protein